MKYAVVCAGGPFDELMDMSEFNPEETVFIGADRGAYHLLKKGIIPHEAVGDFDSVTKEEFDTIASIVEMMKLLDEEKDETDMEVAVQHALRYGPEHVVMTGITGGRLDHYESALHLLYRLKLAQPKTAFSIRNTSNELMILMPGVHRVKVNYLLPYMSFYAFDGIVEGLTLTGFKYETVDAQLQKGMTRFTSNELEDPVCTISFREGICLMVRSSDS